MDKWLPPAIVAIVVLNILVPWCLLGLAAIIGTWLVANAINRLTPPGPYLTLAGPGEVRINWLSKEVKDTFVVIRDASGKETRLRPDRVVKNVLGRGINVNSALVSGLSPGKKYYYQVYRGNNHASEHDGWARKRPWFPARGVSWFKVPPARIDEVDDWSGDENDVRGVRIVVLGDIQPRKFDVPILQWLIAKKAARLDPDVVVIPGDLTMNGNVLLEWKWFIRCMAPLASHVPFIAVLGNHDRKQRNPKSDVPGLEVYSTFLPTDHGKTWQSVQVANIRIIALDFDERIGPGSEQHDFIVQEIARLDNATPARCMPVTTSLDEVSSAGEPLGEGSTREPGHCWLVLVSHATPYNTAINMEKRPQRIIEMREHIQPLVERHHGTWLGGHEHAYQRFTVNGIHYITSGATSSYHRHLYTTEHMERNVIKFHFVVMDVSGEKMVLKAIPLAGKEIDRVEIAAMPAGMEDGNQANPCTEK